MLAVLAQVVPPVFLALSASPATANTCDFGLCSLTKRTLSLQSARRNAMGFVKRVLLFVAVGSVSLVLAGCYGAMGTFRDRELFSPPPPDPGVAEAVPDVETIRALSPE